LHCNDATVTMLFYIFNFTCRRPSKVAIPTINSENKNDFINPMPPDVKKEGKPKGIKLTTL